MKNLNLLLTLFMGIIAMPFLTNSNLSESSSDGNNVALEINSPENILDRCIIGNDGDLGSYSNLESQESTSSYISDYQAENQGQIKAMNISNRLIQSLIDEHYRNSNVHDGYRVYYGDRNGSRVAILKPMENSDGRLVEKSSAGTERIVSLEYGAESPCPMLCD